MVDASVRNTDIADSVKLGAMRVLSQSYNAAGMFEVGLPNDRRADILAVGPKGEIHIVEVKSSVQDFKTDTKWREYREFCDYFYFAVMADFPEDILPQDEGLIFADAFGGALIRPPKHEKLAAGRRKSLLIRHARLASWRLQSQIEPSC